MEGIVTLKGMEFLGHHGCFEEERIIGARFSVDLSFTYVITQTVLSDNVEYAIDYRKVYLDVKEVMSYSVNTLERLSENILEMLKKKYPQMLKAELAITKLNPALGGKLESVTLTTRFPKN